MQASRAEQLPEVAQLVVFIGQVEEMWAQLTKGEFACLLKLPGKGGSQPSKAPGGKSGSLAFPAELSSKLTHQITQITVFYQLNRERAGFHVPTRKVSSIAQIAKQVVV